MTKVSKVLALKYRPQIFEDLIGQEIISKSIFNSIKFNKVPNAYLFTGIRGIGKTTVARIIAKSLNCINGVENLCRSDLCENCKGIINSNHIDVLEMDAASKTGVDDVRDLIEFSKYAPSTAKYKIFIIDEVHMLSKQAFNALLKTLEEPPEYLKFIFATTEIKKIPVTVISRCQRYDLSRVKYDELFNYLKKIIKLEEGNLSEDVVKLITKISEGSVRDALSLLDRALIASTEEKELSLSKALKIYGYFDKSYLIELFENLLNGKEKELVENYKSIYESGVEAKIFLNDFLEILYYLKNIDFIQLDGKNFSLNDYEFKKILEISKKISPETILLYWQFTLRTLGELDIVSNQNIAIEMFLIRLMYLKKINIESQTIEKKDLNEKNISNTEKLILNNNEEDNMNYKNKTISQIKNISQPKNETKSINDHIEINKFNDLINLCNEKKEIKLKYELENNVNLVNFESERIEISFNGNLDKNFVKDLSGKLFQWTNKRWIISFSKEAGLPSRKQVEKKNKDELLKKASKSIEYKKIVDTFPDAKLIEINEDFKND
tara:strand:- start:4814 stop:6469 length:1656 start_codon:yes stop_codon:yes gene_type:complete